MRRAVRLCVATFTLLIAVAVPAAAADPQQAPSLDRLATQGHRYQPFESKCTDIACDYHLRGEITPASVSDLKAFLAARQPGKPTTVTFDSFGGDITAAMALGRLIRANAPISGVVFPSNTCASACVLALIGATHRFVEGARIGVHRPYSADTTATGSDAHSAKFKSVEAAVRRYLLEMNVGESLLDEMLRYEAESVHYLSKDELSRFRISGTDYIWQDRADSAMARRYSIDKATYLRRKVMADRNCAQSLAAEASAQQWVACRDAILSGK